MKYLYVMLLLCVALAAPSVVEAQSKKKKAEQDMIAWRYELEAVGVGVQGTYLVKVWSYSKDVYIALEQAKKNAVHGIIFKGFPGKEGVPGQRPLAHNPNLEQERSDFFDDFFADGSKFMKFVSLVNHGEIGPGDRIKVGKKEYKIGVIISVNVEELRKDLEAAGVIRSLTSGF